MERDKMALTNEDLEAIKELFTPVYGRLDQIDSRLDKADSRFDQIDKKFVQIDSRFDQIDHKFVQIDNRLDKADSRFDQIDNRLEIIEYKQDRTARKLNDLKLDVAVAERDIRKDIHSFKDQTETIIEILKQNALIPQ